MRKTVKSAKKIHYQNIQKQFPFKGKKDPWPLCGLISKKKLPKFSDLPAEKVNCEKCIFLEEYYHKYSVPVEQLDFNDL